MRKQGRYIIDKRIKFKKGLQRRFILTIKKGSGKTWKEISKYLGVSDHTVRVEWATEVSTLPYKKAKKIHNLSPFVSWEDILSKWVSMILPKRWGQILGGSVHKKSIKKPRKSVRLAEFLGIVLGDGHLDKKEFNLSSDANEESYVKYVEKLINSLFGLESRIFHNYCNKNNLFLDTYSCELIEFLVQNSMRIGDKIKNKASFPKWIFLNKSYMKGAIRGLFDTDGGIYAKQKGYKRAIVEFQTNSPYINKDLIKLLKLLEFHPSKTYNKRRGKLDLRIQNQDEVHRFFKIVGSKNLRNIIRYKAFKKNGLVPKRKETVKLIKKYLVKRL